MKVFKSDTEKRLELCEEQINNLQKALHEVTKDFYLFVSKIKQIEQNLKKVDYKQDMDDDAFSDYMLG